MKQASDLEEENNKANSSSPPPVVVRREPISRTPKEEDSSSSSLTEEQINLLGKYLEPTCDISNSETSGDEQDNNDSSDISAKTEELTEEIEPVNVVHEMIESHKVQMRRNGVKPKIKTKPNFDKGSIDENSTRSDSVRSMNSTISKISLTKLNRKVLHSEYGYLIKIAFKKDLSETENNNEILERNNNWERRYFLYFSDNTIGICSNPNVIILININNGS